jgi:hypothetical protein
VLKAFNKFGGLSLSAAPQGGCGGERPLVGIGGAVRLEVHVYVEVGGMIACLEGCLLLVHYLSSGCIMEIWISPSNGVRKPVLRRRVRCEICLLVPVFIKTAVCLIHVP